MTVRVSSGSDNAPAAVEQFGNGSKVGCIVRWDFENIKSKVYEVNQRTNSQRGISRGLGTNSTSDSPTEDSQQGVEVDTGRVAYSEMRYLGIQDPDKVVADIEADIVLRYGDDNRPEIDLYAYRSAIVALKNV